MKNKYAFLISLFTAFGFIFLAHGVTHAAVWPGNQWGSDTNISIKLSQNQRHPDYRGSAMYFAYYVKDGQGSKSIKFINTECGYKGKAEVTNFWAGPKINFSSGGDCGNKTLNLTDKSSMELPDGKYDVYYIVARLTNASGSDPEDKASMFKFDIEYDSNGGNNFIGYIANSDGSLPIASNRGDVYLPDIKIKISCEASGPGKINLYDSDNNKDLYAQPDDYRPMKLKINGSASYDGHDNVQGGWGGPNANDFYWPNDTTSATTRWIRYTFTPTEQQQTYLIIRDLGGNNYTSIGLPFNEYPKDCSKPKCPPPYDYLRPPFCPTSRTYNWALEATSQASQKLIIKGQSVVFTHTQKPVSIPGWTSDASTTDYVKSAHAKRLQIRDFAFNYSVDGEATEDYTAVGSEKRWFSNDIAVEVKTGTFTTLAQTPVALKNGNKLLSLKADGVYLDEVPSAPLAGQFSVSGTTITYGAGSTPSA